MKPLYTLIIFVFLFCSCRKGKADVSPNLFLKNVEAALKDSMTSIDYANLDFSKILLNEVDSMNLHYVRIPFKGKELQNDFVIVKTNSRGSVEKGKIIHLERSQGSINKRTELNGDIFISSLNRKAVLNSSILNGYITAFHKNTNRREADGQPIYPSDELPEVVVVAYVRRIEPVSYSSWFLLSGFFRNTDAGEGVGGGYYGSMDGGYDYGGGGGTYGGSSGSGAITVDPTILVDADNYANKEAIDIEQYLKCFDKIADAGAQCEVGIYADVPVDSDPNKLFDFNSGSPGHTFIQIKKLSADGTQSVLQNIGFYPKSGWKTGFTNAPIAAKFVDDGGHELNAGYTKTLTPDEFKSVLTEIRYLKNAQYDIDNFNCTDWALDIFNKQGYGLTIPLYDIPGNYPSSGTSMPQGVYNKLAEMKRNSDVHSDKIQIGFLKAWVADSNGPCY